MNYYRWCTCSRSDAHQSGDHPLSGADDGWLLEEYDVQEQPSEQASGSADVGVEHGKRGINTGHVRITTVEPGPPHPQ